MTIQVLMPALSPTMTEGKLAKWLKREGEAIASGDVIAEIETDKATMEVEAVDEGVLGKILVPEGSEGVAVNAPIAILLTEGEDASALAGAATPAPTAQPVARADGQRIFASPLARRLAAEGGLDLAGVTGSGPHGRIVKRDVEAALAAPKAAPPPPPKPAAEPAPAKPAPAPAVEGMAAYDEVPHSTMRKVIAKRLSESKRDIPHYYLTIDARQTVPAPSSCRSTTSSFGRWRWR